MSRKNKRHERPQVPKVRRSAEDTRRVMELRRSNAATAIPSGRVYNRHDTAWRKEW